MSDPVSPELRKIEAEVDSFYQTNPLMRESFETAAWLLLSVAEDSMFIPLYRSGGGVPTREAVDNLVNNLNWSFRWLYQTCRRAGTLPTSITDAQYRVASELIALSDRYQRWESAFTLASRKKVELRLQGSHVLPNDEFLRNKEYEGYNRLIEEANELTPELIPTNIFDTENIRKTLRTDKNRFSYSLNPKLVSEAMAAFLPFVHKGYTLPDHWSFRSYDLHAYRSVTGVISTVCFIHVLARLAAVSSGCEQFGIMNGLIAWSGEELCRRVSRYSGIKFETVQTVVGDLTYGSGGISQPDTALQPIIEILPDVYVLVPNLWLSLNAERNLCVLLNKLPREKENYSRLVAGKETSLRDEIIDHLGAVGLRFCQIPPGRTLPNIDLAIIDDSRRVCLITDLKWFIAPAETREIIEKSEEIQKGIYQLRTTKQRLDAGDSDLLKELAISADYEVGFAVVSENWIGHEDVQDDAIPVINSDHLVRKIGGTGDLNAVITWLTSRQYLPVSSVHFEAVEIIPEIASWNLHWYGIRSLDLDSFRRDC